MDAKELRIIKKYWGDRFQVMRAPDETLLDTKTGLEWFIFRHADAQYSDALKILSGLSKFWRLPSVLELTEIFNSGWATLIHKGWMGPFKHSGLHFWCTDGDESTIKLFHAKTGNALMLNINGRIWNRVILVRQLFAPLEKYPYQKSKNEK